MKELQQSQSHLSTTEHLCNSHGYFEKETAFLWYNFLLKIRVRQKGNTGQFVATVHSGSQEEGGSVFQGQGAFNNYVDQILRHFDHLPPSSKKLGTFYIIPTRSCDQALTLYQPPTHLYLST